MSIETTVFGSYEGKTVYRYTLTNRNGAYLSVLNYGGILQRLYLPDREGRLGDIVCGFDSVEDYVTDASSYTGSLVGRYANRISEGGFTLDGRFYSIALNEKGRCHLHGGVCGFNRRLWQVKTLSEEGADTLILTLTSPDGEEGYPGNLRVEVRYTFDDANTLTLTYRAETDKPTVVNLTNHAYFNLNGYDGRSVMEQELRLYASRYDEVDESLLPIGAPRSVEGTAFDFRQRRPIARPYDHNFHIDGPCGTLRPAAEAYDGESGRTLTLYTDLPAVQLYTAVMMDGKTAFKGGVPQRKLHAFCLETQYSPDTPHRPELPSCVVTPKRCYTSTTRFVFGVDNR